MKAYIEILSGIIRVGQDCEKYGDPYDYAVAFSSTNGKTAVLKALVSDGNHVRDHGRVAIKAVNNLGLIATWERL